MKLVTFGALCVLALLVAIGSRVDRRCLATSASVILGNWLLFSMPWIYAPASFAFVAKAAGFHVHQIDGWAIIELCSLICIIGCCWRVWWGPLLWIPTLVNLVMYAVAYANDLEYIQYQSVLDASLSVQLAVVFLIGGPSCADRVSRCWRVHRVVRDPTRDVANRV